MADQPKITITEITVEHPQGFGGHEFEYRDADDLFACVQCGGCEIPLRRPDGSIQECPVSLSLAADAASRQQLISLSPSAAIRDGTG